MSEIEVGQVLALKIRFNNSGTISGRAHPYLVVGVDDEFGTVEIAQLDSLEGKKFKAAMRSNKVIFCDDPVETVIDKDSFVQLDNTFKIENFQELNQFRRQIDKLSNNKLSDVLRAYREYHDTHLIDENKNVYMSKEEIIQMNQ